MSTYRAIVADPPWPYEDGALGHQRSVGKERFLAYPTMTLEEIAALPVAGMAAPGAHLYVWTTNRFLWDTPRIMRAWGFDHPAVLTWCKKPMGSGGGTAGFANTTEFIVCGRKRFGAAIKARRIELGLSCAELERRVRNGTGTGLAQRWEEDDTWPSAEYLGPLAAILGWDVDEFAGPPLKRWDTTWFEWKRGAHSQKPDAFLDLVEQTSPGPFLEMFARRARFGWSYWGNESLGTEEMAA